MDRGSPSGVVVELRRGDHIVSSDITHPPDPPFHRRRGVAMFSVSALLGEYELVFTYGGNVVLREQIDLSQRTRWALGARRKLHISQFPQIPICA